MNLAIRECRDGVLLPLRVLASARDNSIRGIHNGALKVSVSAAPEKGRANKAIIKLLSDSLAIRKTSLRMIAGATSPQKQVLVTGIPIDDLKDRIQGCLLQSD